MSIRLRLTLLYSAILALTLIVLGFGIYASVSDATLGSARDAVNSQAGTVATSLEPHLGPRGGFGGPNQHGGGGGGGQDPNQLQTPAQSGDLGTFIAPPDVAVQNAIQVRQLDGTIIYRSQDLKSANVTLPLSAAARQQLRPGTSEQAIVSEGQQRLLVATVLIFSHGTPSGILQLARSLHDMDQTLRTLRDILLIGGAIATLLACGVGWWLAGTALHPINRITQTAREIGTTQDFNRRVTYTGPPDEVGRLAGTFNTMLSRLQEAYHTQRRFVADASHELRTPLTSIRGNLGLLQRNPPIAENDRVAVLADLVSESERLSRLVASLLTLARGDTGRVPRQEPVALSPLVADVVRRLAVPHPERVVQEDAPIDAAALGDPDALTQVLLILLDNALKFTPATGRVTVRTTVAGEMVSIAVSDTGHGIAPEALPHIFERFYQGDTARTGMGTGLGLAIAGTLVDALKGSIQVRSTLGEGSVFTVTLPASRGSRHG